MAARLQIPADKDETFRHIISIMEQESGLDAEAAMANMRFSFITRLCRKTLVRPHESKEHRRSVAIDRILTGHYTAVPSFVAIMGFIFRNDLQWCRRVAVGFDGNGGKVGDRWAGCRAGGC